MKNYLCCDFLPTPARLYGALVRQGQLAMSTFSCWNKGAIPFCRTITVYTRMKYDVFDELNNKHCMNTYLLLFL